LTDPESLADLGRKTANAPSGGINHRNSDLFRHLASHFPPLISEKQWNQESFVGTRDSDEKSYRRISKSRNRTNRQTDGRSIPWWWLWTLDLGTRLRLHVW
jgi:hypothetical protein